MCSILTVQPDGARKEKRKIKGMPKKAVTSVHLEYREVLEEGNERRAAFAQLRRALIWFPQTSSLMPISNCQFQIHDLTPIDSKHKFFEQAASSLTLPKSTAYGA